MKKIIALLIFGLLIAVSVQVGLLDKVTGFFSPSIPAETVVSTPVPASESGIVVDDEYVQKIRIEAEQGKEEAQIELGNIYYFGYYGAPQDEREALRWYQKVAEKGNPIMQYQVAFMHYTGRGIPQDYQEAFKWYQKSADLGNELAQFRIGFMYSMGEGVDRDQQKAIEWYKKAAENRHFEAAFNLALMYYNGNGIPQDFQEALKWCQKAAEENFVEAQIMLSDMYFMGVGTSKDNVKAYMWLNLAQDQGPGRVEKLVEIITKEMTPEQIEEAKKLVQEWKEKRMPPPPPKAD